MPNLNSLYLGTPDEQFSCMPSKLMQVKKMFVDYQVNQIYEQGRGQNNYKLKVLSIYEADRELI